MKEIGIKVILSTSNHQQTDGQSERKIQEIQTYFRIYMDFEQKNWKELCPIAQYAINDAESSSTKETPSFVLFGFRRNEKTDEKDVPRQKKMEIIHNEIRNELEWTKDLQKRYYDKNRVEAITLKEGEKVYLRRRNMGEKRFNIRTQRRSSKFDYRKLGPFLVKRCLDYDNYELKLPDRMKIHPVFHISLLSKTVNQENEENIEVHNEDEFEVERIINKRIRKGQVEYLIKWLGYDISETTWEPTKNLFCPDKIQEFEASNSETPGRVIGERS